MSDKFEKEAGQFAKKADGGKRPVAGYEAEAIAMRAKSARLRELRLAREAELAASRPAPAPAPRGAAKSAKKKGERKPAGTLADWIKARDEGGHRN